MIQRKDWQQHEIDFILSNFHNLSNTEIGNSLGRSKASVRMCLFVENRKVQRPQGEKIFNVLSQVEKTKSKKEKIALIIEAMKLISTRPQGYTRTAKETKTIRSRIAGNKFENGNKPWNAGTRGVNKANGGSFTKGNTRNHTSKYDNAISIKTNPDGRKYKMIRIAPNQWEYLQRHNWIITFGPIPEGYIVTFIDGDSLNCEPENLMCIPDKNQLLRNIAKSRMKHKYRKEVIEAVNKQSEHMPKKKMVRVKKQEIDPKLQNKIPFRIDSKTVIYVSPNADMEKLKQLYKPQF